MIVAVASGKGGTGKTTVATCLAKAAASADVPVALLDCDVEAPNAHLFMKPRIRSSEKVCVPVPQVDETKCRGCKTCHEVCQFNAILCLKAKPMVFEGLCHGCGGCALACPEGAILEVPREIGTVERGVAGDVAFAHGKLNVGEPAAGPLIRAVKAHAPADGLTLLDAPPGTSCPVVETLRGAGFVVLVTEPTPFGLHDLKLAVETVRRLDLPFGVVINRADIGDARTREYCRDEGIVVMLDIPDDRRIAEAYSRAQAPVDALPECRALFDRLLQDLLARAPS